MVRYCTRKDTQSTTKDNIRSALSLRKTSKEDAVLLSFVKRRGSLPGCRGEQHKGASRPACGVHAALEKPVDLLQQFHARIWTFNSRKHWLLHCKESGMEMMKALPLVVTILVSCCVLEAHGATPATGAATMVPEFPFHWIRVHGWLMFLGMGLLMPVAIVLVRFTRVAREKGDLKTVRVLVYTHIFVQVLAVIAVTCGAAVGFTKFDNEFAYTHERLGLALWILVWLAPLVGLVRPEHGARTRPIWYGIHWLLGTGGVVLGFYNIFSGMHVYEVISRTSLRTLNIMFSVYLSAVAVIYLTQDRWSYAKQQGIYSKSVTPVYKGQNGKEVSGPEGDADAPV